MAKRPTEGFPVAHWAFVRGLITKDELGRFYSAPDSRRAIYLLHPEGIEVIDLRDRLGEQLERRAA